MVEWAALATFISVVGAACAGLIHAIQNSKCTTINTPCLSCTRVVGDVEEPVEMPIPQIAPERGSGTGGAAYN